MSQVLYRKYRPEKLSEVVGQDHIVQTLLSALKNDRVSHAYLFTGPHGVGKTSVARILAYEANGLKYGDRSAGLDIIEIDGASNRRIEEIRDLRDRVHITPVYGKYKIYIIDEVHMLTKEAFNALLKTLEEPPAHCIFILATTEAHKLPETIISRTQRFSFKPISEEAIADHLTTVAKKEKLDIDQESLYLLAKHGQGSFRDSLGLLDQLRSATSKISAKFVQSYLGVPSSEQVHLIVEAISAGNLAELSKSILNLKNQAISPAATARSIGEDVRARLVNGDHETWQTPLLKDLLEVATSAMPQERLEIALFEAASQSTKPATKPPTKPEESTKLEQNESVTEPRVNKNNMEPEKSRSAESKSRSSVNFTLRDWHRLIAKVKEIQPAAAIALKHGIPEADGSIFKIIFEFPLYKKKLDKTVYKDLIGQVLSSEFNINSPIELDTDKDKFKKNRKPELQTITNIFGGGEVVESTVSV